MKLFRKALILAHRYLGIAIGLLVAMWFVTGIAMMYSSAACAAPHAGAATGAAAALDLARVQLTTSGRRERADLGEAPERHGPACR